MKLRIAFLFLIFSSLGFQGSLFAGTNDDALIVAHVKATAGKTQCPGFGPSQDPNTLGIPCSSYDTEWPVGAGAHVFLVAARGSATDGILAMSCGVDYGANLFVSWTLCADLEFQNDGGNGLWPASLGGNRILWNTCQNTVVGSDGVHAIAGYFYVFAYGNDKLEITPNNNIVSGPELVVTDCATLDSDLLGSATGSIGFGTDLGLNPCGPLYEITSISDVGNDQGRQVRIRWNRNAHDQAGSSTPTTFYGVWRRISALLAAGGGETRSDRKVSDLAFPPGEWEYVTSVPASGEAAYATVVPTLCDSTGAGICWSSFLIRAQTAMPTVFQDTPPDSGYSVDNLAPSAPMSLTYSAGILIWDPAPEADFDYFTVYGSKVDHLDGSAVLVDHTVNPLLDVSQAPHSYYHVTATDFADNEGEAATTFSALAVPEPGFIPSAYGLLQNHPNPHRAATVIGFDLPETGPVALRVFDVNGRLVKVLVDGALGAGRYSMIWRGDDLSGAPATPGIYFYRLETSSYRETRKTLFLGG